MRSFKLKKYIQALRYSAAGIIAIFVFFGWVNLVGPQIHVVETVIGLALTLATFGYIMFLTRRGKKKPPNPPEY